MPDELQIVMKAKDILKKSDFDASFEQVLKLVLKIQEQQAKAIQDLERTHNALMDQMGDEYSSNLSALKGKVDKLFVGERLDGMDKELKRKLNELQKAIDLKVRSIKNGRDGKDGVQGKMGLPGAQGSPDLGEEIKEKLELLTGDDRLDKSAIKGIDEEVKDLRTRIAQRGGFKQLRAALVSFAGDGTTTAFTLPAEPTAEGRAIFLYYNGQWLQPDTHYTIRKLTLTTTFVMDNGTRLEGFMFVL